MMSAREKIILILMILAVLFGLFEFLFSTPSDPEMMVNKKKLEELKNSLSSSAVVISTGKLSDNQSYIIDTAAMDWIKNPFKDNFSHDTLSKKKVLSGQEGKDNKKGIRKLIYSGFLSMTKKQMAIINGLEYEVGDELETGGYIVKQIKPSEVLLKMKNQDKIISITLSE
ncbi:hypothetical protein ACFL1N_04810 [Thermodesulfobacteriota bacterium]